jgi:hypothetical protein
LGHQPHLHRSWLAPDQQVQRRGVQQLKAAGIINTELSAAARSTKGPELQAARQQCQGVAGVPPHLCRAAAAL